MDLTPIPSIGGNRGGESALLQHHLKVDTDFPSDGLDCSSKNALNVGYRTHWASVERHAFRGGGLFEAQTQGGSPDLESGYWVGSIPAALTKTTA
jgi:hypothetical protein